MSLDRRLFLRVSDCCFGKLKPEDTVKQQQLGLINPQVWTNHHQNPTFHFSGHGVPGQTQNNGDLEDDDMDMDEDEEEEDEEEEEEEEGKMGYKIEFQQRQNNRSGPANGGGSGAAAAFLAMVQ